MTTATVKYPDVSVQLTGEDPSTFRVLSRVVVALRDAGYGDEIDAFYTAANECCDYAALLRLVKATVVTR